MVQKGRNCLKEGNRRRNEERSRTTFGKDSTRTQRRKEMRSSRGISNDASRRMDEEYGSGNENGRRSNHPTNQEVDEEREKDRSNSGKSIGE